MAELQRSNAKLKANQAQLRNALQQKLDEHSKLMEVVADLTTQVCAL